MKRTPEEEHIFRALAQIETPEADLSAALRRAEEPRRIRPVRPLAAAAVLCALLTIGAAAVGFSGAWRYFVHSLPQNAVQTVGASQTSGDYTLTVEEAVVDDSNFMLLLALTRADGEPIDPEASLTTNSMDLEVTVDGHYFGRATDYQLSPDGKTIYICYENRGSPFDVSVLDSPITISADGVAVQLWDEEDHFLRVRSDTPVSLAPLAGLEGADYTDLSIRDEATAQRIVREIAGQGRSIPLPMEAAFPGYAVLGAALTDHGLTLLTVSDVRSDSGELVCTEAEIDALIDTRTGARYEEFQYDGGGELKDGTPVQFYSFMDSSLCLDDLPYLEVEVSYAIDRVLSDNPFSFTFTVNKSSGLSVPIPETLELSGVTLHPVELRLSALAVIMTFDDFHEDIQHAIYEHEAAPVLHLKDGSSIDTHRADSSSREWSSYISFRPEDANGDRLFIDPAQVVSITFGNLEIPVVH